MSSHRIVLALVAALAITVAAAPSSATPSTPDVKVVKCKKGSTKMKINGKIRCVKKKAPAALTGTGPYKLGQVCSTTKNLLYARYGLVCLDLSTPGYPLTTLAKK